MLIMKMLGKHLLEPELNRIIYINVVFRPPQEPPIKAATTGKAHTAGNALPPPDPSVFGPKASFPMSSAATSVVSCSYLPE